MHSPLSQGRTYAHAFTSLTDEQAGAALLAHLVQGRGRIEALHHVRIGHGPQSMAMLRDLAIPLLTEQDASSITPCTRWCNPNTKTTPGVRTVFAVQGPSFERSG